MHRWITVPLAVVLGGTLALGGVYLGNRVNPATSASSRSMSGGAVVGSGPSTAAGAPAVGGAVALADPSPVQGLPGAGWMLPVDLVGPPTGQGAGATTSTTAPVAGPVVPTPASPVPADQAAETAQLLGSAQLDSAAGARRFLDGCAAGVGPCPLGIGADVVPFDLADAPPLTVRIWPGVTTAVLPSLRCDPGYRTSERLPVVITSNLPLQQLEVALSVVDGPPLDRSSRKGPDNAEQDWFQIHVGPQGAVGTDLGTGLQYCASLRTEGDQGVASGLPKGIDLSGPVVYRIRVEASVGGDGPSTTQQLDVGRGPVDERPPVTVWPLSGNVAQVTVPELDPARYARPVVWATEWSRLEADATAVCRTRPPPDYVSSETWRATLSDPQPYETDALAAADYPYDRAWTHFAVTNLVVRESSDVVLCVQWPESGAVELQGISLEAPDGLTFTLELTSFAVTKPWDEGWRSFSVLGRDVACHTDDLHDGSTPTELLCDSRGLSWPWYTTLDAVVFDDQGRTIDMGSTTVASFTWCSPTPDQVGSPLAVMILIHAAASGCGDETWDVTITWRDPVLCNDTFGDCEDHVRARATARAQLTDQVSNGRRAQLDWLVQTDLPAVTPTT